METKKCLALAIVAVLILVIGIVLPASASAQGKGPIKVGLLYPATGVFGAQGSSETNAAKQLFEEKGLKVGGRTIQLILDDTEGKPDVALTKTKRVVELDKADIICGYLSTAEGYAIRDYVHDKKIPTIVTGVGARHTRDMFSPYLFRLPPSAFQITYEPSKWWYQHGYKGKTYKTLIWIGADYAAAREHFQGFKKGFEEVGGKIIQELWPILGATDFGPYLSSLKVDEADALVAGMWGDMPVRLVYQWVEYGLNKRIPIIGLSSFTDEGITLPGMGVNANGILSCYPFCPQTDIPENKKFVEGYKKRYNALPGHYAYFAYISAQAAYEAMDKLKGNVEDKVKFAEALGKVNYKTPMGYKVYFDAKHGMVYDFLYLEARKTNGECHLFEIGRIKEVKDPYDVFP